MKQAKEKAKLTHRESESPYVLRHHVSRDIVTLIQAFKVIVTNLDFCSPFLNVVSN